MVRYIVAQFIASLWNQGDPFDTSQMFGIDSNPHAFIPFDTTGTVVHSESCVPTEWLEEDHGDGCASRITCAGAD
jgi:hypothetical protein